MGCSLWMYVMVWHIWRVPFSLLKVLILTTTLSALASHSCKKTSPKNPGIRFSVSSKINIPSLTKLTQSSSVTERKDSKWHFQVFFSMHFNSIANTTWLIQAKNCLRMTKNCTTRHDQKQIPTLWIKYLIVLVQSKRRSGTMRGLPQLKCFRNCAIIHMEGTHLQFLSL